MTDMITLTWDLLVRCEPRLGQLDVIVKAIRPATPNAPFCANAVWYCGLKPFLMPLVGWDRGHHDFEQARDPDDDRPRLVSWGELFDTADKDRVPAENEWERLLRTEDAYNVAYDHLYRQLPACRGCQCIGN